MTNTQSVLPRTAGPSPLKAHTTLDSPASSSSKDLVATNPLSQPSSQPENRAPLQLRDNHRSDDSRQPEGLSETLLKDDHGRPFYIGPSPTASFLSQANKNIDQLRNKFLDQGFQTSAENSLSELSNTFAAVHFEDVSNVRMNVRMFRRSNEAFFIPGKEEGLEMIQSKSLFYPPWDSHLTREVFLLKFDSLRQRNQEGQSILYSPTS
jgi:hypothetical protein